MGEANPSSIAPRGLASKLSFVRLTQMRIQALPIVSLSCFLPTAFFRTALKWRLVAMSLPVEDIGIQAYWVTYLQCFFPAKLLMNTMDACPGPEKLNNSVSRFELEPDHVCA